MKSESTTRHEWIEFSDNYHHERFAQNTKKTGTWNLNLKQTPAGHHQKQQHPPAVLFICLHQTFQFVGALLQTAFSLVWRTDRHWLSRIMPLGLNLFTLRVKGKRQYSPDCCSGRNAALYLAIDNLSLCLSSQLAGRTWHTSPESTNHGWKQGPRSYINLHYHKCE